MSAVTNAIYLDHNATAPLRDEAREAMIRALSVTGNPSSVHGFGRAARRLVEEGREAVAALVGTSPAQLVFTSGGTEANAMALGGLAEAGRRVVVSAVEHPSVLKAQDATLVPALPDGRMALEALDEALDEAFADAGPAVVSLMAANNETGVIQPLAESVEIARRHGALVHCDGIQAAGKIPIDFNGLDVDMLSLSAHKIGGPPGVGALVLRDGVVVPPLMRGGGQERGRRAGTENVPGIAGFGAAARAAQAGLDAFAGLAGLRDGMERRILEICPSAEIFGREVPRLANTSCVAMPGVPAETQIMAFDLAGIAVSAGSACSSGKVAASHVLAAMGVDDDRASTAIRVSLGWDSDASEIDAFVTAWTAIYGRAGAAAA